MVVLMREATGVIGVSALVLVIFSGCVAEDPAGKDDSGSDIPADARPAEFSDDTGAIEGFVLDESELPITAATVGIPDLGADIMTRTDTQGRFTLSNLPPGDYVVHATALGFQPGQAKASVVPGDATRDVEILLVAAATDEPYSVTDIRKVTISGVMWKVTPSCIYTDDPLIKTCGGLRIECNPSTDDCEVHYGSKKDFTNEWKTLIGEVTWQAQSGATGKGFSFDINAPNITRGSNGAINGADPHQFQLASNKAPIRIQVDEAALTAKGTPASDWNNMKDCETGNCDWFWRIFPAAYDLGIGPSGLGPDYGVMYQNPVDIYFTYFIKAPAPGDFTALPVA